MDHSARMNRRLSMRFALALALAGAFSAAAFAQDEEKAERTLDEKVEKVLDKAIEAMGGEKVLDKIESSKMVMVMTSSMDDSETTSTMYYKKPDKFYSVMQVPQMGEMKSGSNGKVAWSHNAMSGYQNMDADLMKGQGTMADMITQLKETYDPLEHAGAEKFDDLDCVKLRGVDENDTETFIYFDTDTGLIAGMKATREIMPGQSMESITVFKDWKKVGDVTVPHTVTSETMGMKSTMIMKEISFNDVPDSRFELPAEVKQLAAEQGGGGAGG